MKASVMKKTFLLTLAFLCAAAVQAITLSWEESGAFSRRTVATAETGKSIDSITIAAIATFISPGNANFINCYFGNPGVNNYAMRMTNNSTIAAALGTTVKGTEVSVTANEQVAIMMVFEKTSDTRTEMKFYINGALVHTDGFTSNTSTNFSQLDVQAWENTTYIDLEGVAYYEGAATEADVAKFNQTRDFAAVPEPTVFALVALGVAGFALKRKHA